MIHGQILSLQFYLHFCLALNLSCDNKNVSLIRTMRHFGKLKVETFDKTVRYSLLIYLTPSCSMMLKYQQDTAVYSYFH